jgi:hypothetical protein
MQRGYTVSASSCKSRADLQKSKRAASDYSGPGLVPLAFGVRLCVEYSLFLFAPRRQRQLNHLVTVTFTMFEVLGFKELEPL